MLSKIIEILKGYPNGYFNLNGSFANTRNNIEILTLIYREKLDNYLNNLIKSFAKSLKNDFFDFIKQCIDDEKVLILFEEKKLNCITSNWFIMTENDWIKYKIDDKIIPNEFNDIPDLMFVI